MAKGDSKQAKQSIQQQTGAAQNTLDQSGQRIFGGHDIFQGNYNMGSGMNLNSYDDIMNNYRSMMYNPTNPQFGGQQGGMQQDPQAYFQQLTQGLPPTPQSLVGLEQQLGQQGIKVLRNAEGIAGKIQLPNGHIVDVIQNAGIGGTGWQYDSDNGIFGGGGGGGIGDPSQLYAMYQALAQGGAGAGWDPMFRGAMGDAIRGYGNFAETGGFSDQDLADIRARGVAPVRAAYANAQQNLNRNRSLQGFSPNYAASSAKMAREQAYTGADALQNVNAGIAQMVQQGKLAGLGGLSGTGAAGQGLSTNIDQLNLQGKLAGLGGMQGMQQFDQGLGEQARQFDTGARLQALGGMTNLYGTNPAMANVFGNQVLQSQQNMLGLGQLQNQLGLGMSGRQIESSQIPGQSQQIYNSISPWLQLGTNLLGAYMGSRGGGGGGSYRPPVTDQAMANAGIWG